MPLLTNILTMLVTDAQKRQEQAYTSVWKGTPNYLEKENEHLTRQVC